MLIPTAAEYIPTEVDLSRNDVIRYAKQALYLFGDYNMRAHSPQLVRWLHEVCETTYMSQTSVNPHDVRAVYEEMQVQSERVRRFLGVCPS